MGGVEPPGCGVPAGAGAVAARPGSQGGSRDFLLEEAALWQLPVGDGGGGWGKGPPAFMETRRRGAGSAGAGGRHAGAPPLPRPGESSCKPLGGGSPGGMHGDRVPSQRPAAPCSLPSTGGPGLAGGSLGIAGAPESCHGSWAEERPPLSPCRDPKSLAAQGSGRTSSPGPLGRGPCFHHPVPLGPGAAEGSGSPPGPLPCLAPGTATSCTQQRATQLGQLPQTCPRPQASG